MKDKLLRLALMTLIGLLLGGLVVIGIHEDWWPQIWTALAASQWGPISQLAGALLSALVTVVGTAWISRSLQRRRASPDAIEHASSPAVGVTRPPYPGLEAFTAEDVGVFFGRGYETTLLLDRLHPTLPGAAHRFVAVIGPSGSGKSSLVQAGLLPRLAQRRDRWVVLPTMVPGDHPVYNLARSLAILLPNRRADELATELMGGSMALARYYKELCSEQNDRSRLLIVIDQAEELLTLSAERERDTFLRLLRDALQADARLWILATLRSEFLTTFLTTGFANLFQNPVVIGTLDRTSLFEVIQRPAAQAGLKFDPPNLIQRMVDDTGGGDALPLLAYTLQALYLQAESSGIVTAEYYRQLGGVEGALARQADKVMAELQPSSHRFPCCPPSSSSSPLTRWSRQGVGSGAEP